MEFRELGSAFNAMADDIAALIIERKRAEEALRLTQFSIDHAGDAAFWLDREGRVVYANESTCNLLGYSPEELLMTLAAHEFIRRFLIHVLPAGFHRIRHYGLFANGGRAENLARAPPPGTGDRS